MKTPKNLQKVIGLMTFLLALISFSCQEEGSQDFANPGENKSQISMVEETTGTTLFKRDITITDESGENTVTLRIAALDNERLEEYVNSRKLTLIPIYEQKKSKPLKPTSFTQESTLEEEKGNLQETILTEIISQNLKSGVKGIGFRNEPNEEYISANSGRIKYIHNNVRHYSPKWPEILSVQAYNQVYFRIQQQRRWYSGWSTIWGPATWCCYEYADFDIDGPWYVRLEISYDYTGDFYYEWFNW